MKSKVSNGRQVGDWFSFKTSPHPSPHTVPMCFCANVNVLISASAFLHVSRLKYVALFLQALLACGRVEFGGFVYPLNYFAAGYIEV